MSRAHDLARIAEAIEVTRAEFLTGTPGKIVTKAGGDPVTEIDRRVDSLLRRTLVRDQEGWLSEESEDDLARLQCARVWVVDPLDGTREFIAGIPEYCVSIGLVEEGRAVAGGVHNPATNATILGAAGLGVTYNGRPRTTTDRQVLIGSKVLASRTEVARGEWAQVETMGFQVLPVGSVAFKLALVATGQADATWTLNPKNEWDVAAGIALVQAAGGSVRLRSGQAPLLNQRSPRLESLIASGSRLSDPLLAFLAGQ